MKKPAHKIICFKQKETTEMQRKCSIELNENLKCSMEQLLLKRTILWPNEYHDDDDDAFRVRVMV